MKKFIKSFLALSILTIGCLPGSVMAESLNANISVTKDNNLSEKNISGTIIDMGDITQSFIAENGIDSSLNGYDSVIIFDSAFGEISSNTQKVTYESVQWTERVKANIKIGEACINGDKGRNTFDTAVYIQEQSSSTMFPIEAVSYLAGNLNIAEVKTTISDDGASAVIDCGSKKLEFKDGSDKIIIDSKEKTIDNEAVCELKDGKLFMPLRSFADAMDCKIDWTAEGKIVNLEKTFERNSLVKKVTEIESKPTDTFIPTVNNGCHCPQWCRCRIRAICGTSNITDTCLCSRTGCRCDNYGSKVLENTIGEQRLK